MSNLLTEQEELINRIHDEHIARKEAEIERLKTVIESQNRSIDRHLTLITELADALELPYEEWTDQSELVQRAREVLR